MLLVGPVVSDVSISLSGDASTVRPAETPARREAPRDRDGVPTDTTRVSPVAETGGRLQFSMDNLLVLAQAFEQNARFNVDPSTVDAIEEAIEAGTPATRLTDRREFTAIVTALQGPAQGAGQVSGQQVLDQSAPVPSVAAEPGATRPGVRPSAAGDAFVAITGVDLEI